MRQSIVADGTGIIDRFQEGSCVSFLDPDTVLAVERPRLYGIIAKITRSEAGTLLCIENGLGGFLHTIPDSLRECDVRELSSAELVGKINKLLAVVRRTCRIVSESAEAKE